MKKNRFLSLWAFHNLWLSVTIPTTFIHETAQSESGLAGVGRWSQALKQGVVLKLAQSVVVPCGLNWVERFFCLTVNSASRLPSPPSPLVLLPPSQLHLLLDYMTTQAENTKILQGQDRRGQATELLLNSITLTRNLWTTASLTNTTKCWELVPSRWVSNNVSRFLVALGNKRVNYKMSHVALCFFVAFLPVPRRFLASAGMADHEGPCSLPHLFNLLC